MKTEVCVKCGTKVNPKDPRVEEFLNYDGNGSGTFYAHSYPNRHLCKRLLEGERELLDVSGGTNIKK